MTVVCFELRGWYPCLRILRKKKEREREKRTCLSVTVAQKFSFAFKVPAHLILHLIIITMCDIFAIVGSVKL